MLLNMANKTSLMKMIIAKTKLNVIDLSKYSIVFD